MVSQEGKKMTYQTLVSYIDAEVKETQERCVKKCEKWIKMRKNTVVKVGEMAERVKVLNDGTIAFQTVCKGISTGAKLSMFGGPFVMLLGAGASVLANVGYNQCTKRQIEELEKMCAEVQWTLQRDSNVTRQLFHVLTEMRQISEPARVCIRKFHSLAVEGFFDSVPMFRSFTNSAKAIKNIEDPQSISDFVKVVWKETENLKRNPSFRSSFSALLTSIPEVVELIAQIPKIICGAAVVYSLVNGVKAGSCFPCGKVLKALNILTIIKDFGDIMGKLDEFDEYPQLSKDLKAIKSKLEQEMEEISKMMEKMQQCAGNSNTGGPCYNEWYSKDFCLEDICQSHTDFEDYDPDNPFCVENSDTGDCLEDGHPLDCLCYKGNSSWCLNPDFEDSDLEVDLPGDSW